MKTPLLFLLLAIKPSEQDAVRSLLLGNHYAKQKLMDNFITF
ncbi:hypothetical protein [Marinomonas sp.]